MCDMAEVKVGDKFIVELKVINTKGELGNILCEWPDGYVRPIAPKVLAYAEKFKLEPPYLLED